MERFRAVGDVDLDAIVNEVLDDLGVGARLVEERSMSVKVKQHKGKWWIFIDHKGRREGEVRQGRTSAPQMRLPLRSRQKLALREFNLPREEKTRRPLRRLLLSLARQLCTNALPTLDMRPVLIPSIACTCSRTSASETSGRSLCEDVKALIARLVAKGRTRGTIKRVLAPFHEMYSHAVEDGHVAANPASNILRRTRLDAGAKRAADFLKREELAHLLTTCRTHEPDSYALVLLLARTGMRLGEAVSYNGMTSIGTAVSRTCNDRIRNDGLVPPKAVRADG